MYAQGRKKTKKQKRVEEVVVCVLLQASRCVTICDRVGRRCDYTAVM